MWRCELAALALLVAAAGCSGSVRSGVAVEKDRTDILFGAASSPSPEPAAAAPAPPAIEAVAEEPEAPARPRPTTFPRFLSSPRPACAAAEPDAPVASRSGTELEGRPREGAYRWNGAGTYTSGGARIPVPSSSTRYVRPPQTYTDPVAPSGADFTYRTVEPRVGASGSHQMHWQVKPASQISNDPEGGIVLERIDVLAADGSAQSTSFQASGPGLLFAPLPLTGGEQTWSSTSVDLSRGTKQLTGRVVRRDVVDVCGTRVQGWLVQATLSDGGAGARLEYLVATQLGGLVIASRIDGTWLGTTYDAAVWTIAGLEPEPLPERFR